MTLPLDISRCSGRYDLLPGSEWCPHRHTCQRYLAFVDWDYDADLPDYKGVSVLMAVRGCQHKIEVAHD